MDETSGNKRQWQLARLSSAPVGVEHALRHQLLPLQPHRRQVEAILNLHPEHRRARRPELINAPKQVQLPVMHVQGVRAPRRRPSALRGDLDPRLHHIARSTGTCPAFATWLRTATPHVPGSLFIVSLFACLPLFASRCNALTCHGGAYSCLSKIRVVSSPRRSAGIEGRPG